MRSLRTVRILSSALVLAGPAVAAGEGLRARLEDSAWARWQGRLTLATAAPSWKASLSEGETVGIRVSGVTLSGDYFFSAGHADRPGLGGLRATTALIVGPRAQATSTPPGWGVAGFERRWGAAPVIAAAIEPANVASLPYLGLGYTGLSARMRWSFSADLGLVALYPGNVTQMGRVMGGSQSMDDLLRELRLAPLFQMGVSYSF